MKIYEEDNNMNGIEKIYHSRTNISTDVLLLMAKVSMLVVQEAEKWANELGFTTAVVESRDNKIRFYETMGYVADYSQKIVGETFTCYRMEKQLK